MASAVRRVSYECKVGEGKVALEPNCLKLLELLPEYTAGRVLDCCAGVQGVKGLKITEEMCYHCNYVCK